MMKVLFVCLGNICRSPMAEGIFKDMVNKENLSHLISVDSAATGTWNLGQAPHQKTQQKLAEVGIDTNGMVSRVLNDHDLSYDYIIGMDSSNIANINHFIKNRQSGQVMRLLQFAKEDRDIADPYYTGDFEQTFQDITKGCQGLLEHIKKELNEV
ncbi:MULTISPECIES: low molecular weight protein-tyrosine-phosphatase [unclassified Granulicatella]|uniref:low molecular weight protein-tyrosine-phosphatase n=1 Tax=unclassified Granulicatella TaxID=2630493 RepID=UPI001073B063|nr:MULTISPECIES: low molecular weight protein-tyrosine-phosphatase [unclassified Granulicatella]MBF0780045.1 low molecular weight phosphotyrosine protein phosphatase [Granulicatella sp. 19428wC4_WM01]TFU95895.1 low molecular weight phosphotyrosine protein phosphatase [Granulicatella sp. WM01]